MPTGALLIDEIAPSARNVNRVRLLQALLHGPGRSRAELGRALGLSRATITAVLLDLERAGMVEQAADDAEGRPCRSHSRPTPPTPSGWTSGTATSAPPCATSAGGSSRTATPPSTSTRPR